MEIAEWADTNRLRRFQRVVLRWYAEEGRDLPWRRTRSPYEIWISEIMLQQTTVAAVQPYYERFLGRFGSVQELADADEQEVLQHWEGLGYYSRARNLHRAARTIVDEFGGELPEDVTRLRSLPGVGPYSAGAIASFAFDTRAPIVEANTRRLYARLIGLRDDLRAAHAQRTLWSFAERILPAKEVGRFNQALMDLGHSVCRPVQPDCERCPVKSCCQACGEGLQAVVPLVPDRPRMTPLVEAAVVVRDDQYVLLRVCGPRERWAGLWDFPRIALTEEFPDLVRQRLAGPLVNQIQRYLQEQLRERFQVETQVHSLRAEWKHTVTRYRIRLLCFDADPVDCPADSRLPAAAGTEWETQQALAARPLSTTGRR